MRSLTIIKHDYQYLASASMGADITAAEINCSVLEGLSIQINWTGTSPQGVFYIQVSNDGTNWTSLDQYGGDVSENTGSIMFDVVQFNFFKARLFYDRTSGTGTCNAILVTRNHEA